MANDRHARHCAIAPLHDRVRTSAVYSRPAGAAQPTGRCAIIADIATRY
ncbi:hypothetical protein MYA_2323 [Burkholderia sp. KJ006]|nr:hypothetical protein MYA_2323 [Burkholderia sp. KJ006]